MRRAIALAALFGSVAAFATPAHADEVVLRETLAGSEVRVERDGDGVLSLVTAGGAGPSRWRIGQGTVRSERVTQGPSEVLVLRVEGARAGAALVGAIPGGGLRVLYAGESSGEGIGGLGRTVELRRVDVDRDGALDVVLLERHDALRACGLGRLASRVQRLDGRSMTLQAVPFEPTGPQWIEQENHTLNARSVAAFALPRDAAPTVLPVLARGRLGSGDPGDAPTALVDRTGASAWEARAHDAAVLELASAGLAIERVVLTAPTGASTIPRAFSLYLDGGVRLDVRVPDALLAALQPGARVAVPLVPPLATRCLALVVTEAGPRGGAIAELGVSTALDRDPSAVDGLVRALDGADGDAAGELLLLLGARGFDALTRGFDALGERGAHRVVRLLSSRRTPASAEVLVRALGRDDVHADARAALLRFGPAALDPLARSAASDLHAVDLLAALRAPLDARVRALSSSLTLDPSSWRRVRGFVKTVLEQAAREGSLDAWLTALPAEPGPASRGLSVAVEAAANDAQRAQIAARARALPRDGFETRYRLLLPLAGDAVGRDEVRAVALHDDDDDLRAEAVRALGLVQGSLEGLDAALDDRVPRVRLAAVYALRAIPAARELLRNRLRSDRWPSVRAGAAESLAGDEGSVSVLLTALDDVSVPVVRAVMASLVLARASTVGPRLIAFAEDPRRNPELRAEALSALADRCEPGVAARLVQIVERQSDPMLPPPEQAIGHAALAALARIDFAQARALLARLEANAQALAAITRAARRACPAAPTR